jgi:hypothetical protein
VFDPSAATPTRQAVAGRLPSTRSAVGNRSRLHRGGDGRTASARRFKDLVEDFSGPLGGYAALSQADAVLVREVAARTIEAELVQSRLANDQSVDPDVSVRLGNILARLLAQVERRRKALAPKPPTLAEYAATRGAGKAR